MGSQRDGFITIEQTMAKRGEEYAGIFNRQNITVVIVLRETNNGTVDRADCIRSGAPLDELNEKENIKFQPRNKSNILNKIMSQKLTNDSKKENTSQCNKNEIEKVVNSADPNYQPSKQQCYNDVLHINEESNNKNVLIEDQYFPLPYECNIEQKVVNNTEVLKITKGIYVSGKVCGQNVRFLVDTGADVTLTSLNSFKKFPDILSSKRKD